MALRLEERRVEHHASLALAGATGLTLTEFFAEYLARVTAATEWKKFGVKASVKTFISALLLFLATRVRGDFLKLWLQVAAYAGLGSILWDFIMTAYPGGLWGIAEALSIRTRAAAAAERAIRIRKAEKITPRPTRPTRPPLPAQIAAKITESPLPKTLKTRVTQPASPAAVDVSQRGV